MKSETNELIKAACLINSVGAQIIMDLPGGTYGLSPDDLAEVYIDRNKWLAKHYNVTVWRIIEWLRYSDTNMQCTGMTRKGLQCLNKGQWYVSPDKFMPGVSDRCHAHIGQEF